MNKIFENIKEHNISILNIIILVSIFYVLFGTAILSKSVYGKNRENYSLKIFMDKLTYPNFYTKWGPFPTKYVNILFATPQNKNGQIMDLCLRDFHIASAYRPYQIAGQTYDICSYKAIQQIIEKGARFHYLDLWSSNPTNPYDDMAYPIVRNETLMPEYGKALEFDKVCKIYKKHSWTGTSYPLILYLNLNYTAEKNRFVLNKIANSIWINFNDNLLGAGYSFSKKKIGDIPISNTLNKIIILTNVYPQEGNLQEIVNGVISDNIQTSGKLVKMTQSQLNHGGLKYIYPTIENAVDFNKVNLGILLPPDLKNIFNVVNPNSDIIQIPPNDPHKVYGFNFVAMNYQKPGKERDDYIDFFKESSLILKDDSLRYIPSPPPVIKPQNVKASYAPRKMDYKNGYFTHNL